MSSSPIQRQPSEHFNMETLVHLLRSIETEILKNAAEHGGTSQPVPSYWYYHKQMGYSMAMHESSRVSRLKRASWLEVQMTLQGIAHCAPLLGLKGPLEFKMYRFLVPVLPKARGPIVEGSL
ncbi:MAG: hypothetical protein Q9190_001127, partial [Brigantiaea leucoxantha]